MSKVKSVSLEPAEPGAYLSYDDVLWPDCCSQKIEGATPIAIAHAPSPKLTLLSTPTTLHTISISTVPWRLAQVYIIKTTERKQVVQIIKDTGSCKDYYSLTSGITNQTGTPIESQTELEF
jgi:hypothetical protein